MDEQLEGIKKITEEIFSSRGELTGLTLVVPKTHAVFQLLHRDDDAKDRFQQTFKSYCWKNQVTSFYLISECWMGTDTSTRPVSDPKRMEIVMCSTIAKHHEVVYAQIYRIGGKALLGRWVEPADGIEFASPYWDECLWEGK